MRLVKLGSIGLMRVFVPSLIVIGLPVVVLSVMHGVPRWVVSSCMPPESVIAKVACFSKHRNSMYPKGSMHMSLSAFRLFIMVPILSRDRGWTGNIVGF